MLKITQVKFPIEHSDKDIRNKIVKELNLRKIFPGNVPGFSFGILRRSVDARKKPDIFYVYTVWVDFHSAKFDDIVLDKCKNPNVSIYEKINYEIKEYGTKELSYRPIVIGSGPAGLFAALILSENGYSPIVIERGEKVDKRVEKVANFWAGGSIDKETNVQFGEGGAGTFSDGKLNTVVKDPSGRNQFVLDTFVKYGAKPEVSYDSKPHVGTDVLCTVVKNIREHIIDQGGSFINCCKLTDLVIENNCIKEVIVDNYSENEYFISENIKIKNGINNLPAENIILAIGHSARDTFRMLYNKKINMSQKNFAVGLRIEHKQELIDNIQYGNNHSSLLKPADYKLTNKASNGKSVYSFCMCPGGYVVNASSEEGRLCVNGMSNSDRDSGVANSALIVNVDSDDFGSEDVLAGMYFQEKLEEKAFYLGNGSIPVQYFSDYKNNTDKSNIIGVEPLTKGNYAFSNLRALFTEKINQAIIESIDKFGYTMKGFNDDGSLLLGVESRTSSPVRINRDEIFESSIKGIYPCGEGAGYAGGITSAAIDGLKVAEAIISKYKPINK